MTDAAAPLRALLQPRSIAILGASDRPSIGRSLIESLSRFGYPGAVYPINPRYGEILGHTCYPSVLDVPTAPDVVAFCIGGAHLLEILPQLAQRGVGAAVIY